jgi:hypothetical protein
MPMQCRGRVLVRCEACEELFCLPELAGESLIWHVACAAKTKRVDALPEEEHATRAGVFYSEQRNQLELRPYVEG